MDIIAGTDLANRQLIHRVRGTKHRVYTYCEPGATAKPERMSGEAVRSLRRNEAEPPNE